MFCQRVLNRVKPVVLLILKGTILALGISVHLMHTAKLVRDEMLSSKFTFSGFFDSKTQESSC